MAIVVVVVFVVVTAVVTVVGRDGWRSGGIEGGCSGWAVLVLVMKLAVVMMGSLREWWCWPMWR